MNRRSKTHGRRRATARHAQPVQRASRASAIRQILGLAGLTVAATGFVAGPVSPTIADDMLEYATHSEISKPVWAAAVGNPSVSADAHASVAFARTPLSAISAPAPIRKTAPKPATLTAVSVVPVPVAVPVSPAPPAASTVPVFPSIPDPSIHLSAVPTDPVQGSRLVTPVEQPVISSVFGHRASPLTGIPEMHTGTDFAAPCDTPVLASAHGTVTETGWHPYGGGNLVVVDHGSGLKTTYNHLASIGVRPGQPVSAGEQIAGVGTTGSSTGCHLHFEVVVNDHLVDPQNWL